ncbi:MAG: serine hydrolase [Planctomycetaceae bacterium]
MITDLRKEKNLVGLAAMVMVDGELQAAAVHGVRKNRSGVPLELGDRWHLGGVAKSITATMIAADRIGPNAMDRYSRRKLSRG